MQQNIYYLMSLGTFILCLFVMGISVIRLGLCCGEVKPRLKYCVILLFSLISATQPYYAQYAPNLGSLLLSVSIVILMIDGAPAFRKYKHKNEFYDTDIGCFEDVDLEGDEDETY